MKLSELVQILDDYQKHGNTEMRLATASGEFSITKVILVADGQPAPLHVGGGTGPSQFYPTRLVIQGESAERNSGQK